jgi:hypothetical protein
VSFEFKDLSQEQEEDLFARVQMGVQLTLAEKMRASTGPWQELARLFVDDFPIVYSLMKDRARAKDFQLTLSCFSQVVEVMHPTAADGIPILKTGYSALPKLLDNKSAVDDKIKAHLATVWNTFKDLVEQDPDTFTNGNKYLRGVQTFAPIEMVAVAVLISMYGDTRNNYLLLGDIKAMRVTIREHFADLRMNPPVWKLIWGYIEELEAIRGAVDGSTVNRRIEQAPKATTSDTALVPHSPAKSTPKPGTKRGRPSMKTKPPSILPPQQPFIVKTEEAVPMKGAESPQPKRQRTDPSFMSPAASDYELQNGNTTSTLYTGTHFKASVPTFADFAAGQLPSTSAPPQLASPAPSVTPTIPSGWGTNNLTKKRQSLPPISAEGRPSFPQTSFTPPMSPTSLQYHEKYSYRAPVAPMAAPVPAASVAPMQQPPRIHTPSSSLHRAIARTRPPVKAQPPGSLSVDTSPLRTGLGAFTPQHTEQQWAGEYVLVTPQDQPAPTAPPKRQIAPKPKTDFQRATPAQYDGAIDLTGDDEEDRQSLLSTFRPKAVQSREASAAMSTSRTPSEVSRRSALTESSDKRSMPVRENNPYARFRERGGN